MEVSSRTGMMGWTGTMGLTGMMGWTGIDDGVDWDDGMDWEDESGNVQGNQDVTSKLARKAYFEDPPEGQSKVSSPALSPPGKKQRPLSPSTQIPRCQVEGCTADLSGCKDYHKRHKVCEMHSRAPKAIVAGIEQRFCQQCSRFHILKKFDEGKRSCRRRLVGHNERRRRPHPETHSIFGLGNSFLQTEISTPSMGNQPFCFPENSKPSSFILLDSGLHGHGHRLTGSSPWPLKSRNDNISTVQIECPSTRIGHLILRTLLKLQLSMIFPLLLGFPAVIDPYLGLRSWIPAGHWLFDYNMETDLWKNSIKFNTCVQIFEVATKSR